MLVHTIDKYPSPVTKKQDKPKFVHGSIQHKQYILERNYNSVNGVRSFLPGACWYAKGHKEKGIIIDLEKDVQLVEWEGLKVKFIELWFSGENKSFLFHPSDLRRKK